ncbi:hypothetical protein KOR34_47220 [Posidoniimonas corsicana]|uniref:Uncharacterized protein n=1 Tax=Posidoniimonas corsicana TaxID=1938618 RepID=A0A5C5UUV5_9BACT|nr:hypothetical protein [Posidoniimonas corsicana]TWT30164.1 hypothetical protein KOR34_47220 [Posidoniimonas corsicana]
MATKHLLPCDCGKSIRVEPSQAGDRVVCECGAELDVPPLRQLRDLPLDVQPGDAPSARGGGEWSFRAGVLTAGLLIAAVLAGLGGWWWATEPPMPGGFDPNATAQRMEGLVDQMNAKQAYKQWVEFYSLNRPLAPVTDPRTQAAIDHVRHMRLVRTTLVIAGAVVAVLSLLLFTQLKPRKQA